MLRKSSFKGVPFFVESSDTTVGRRTVTHQFPQRDEPYTEDLGRSAREYTITALLNGDDYIEQADRLREAIESPGAGTLIHPELGEIQVLAVSGATVSFSQSLRTARLSLNFVEAGLNAYPASDSATQTLSRMAADSLISSAIDSFSNAINLDGIEDHVRAALNGDVLDMLGIVSSDDIASVLGFADRVSDLANDAISIISTNPRQFAERFCSAIGLSGLATTAAGWTRVADRLSTLVDNLHGEREEPTYTAVKPASSVEIEENRAAVYSFARQAVIAQVVGVTSIVGTRQDTTVQSVDIFTEDVQDVEVENAGNSSPTVSYNEMMATRDRTVELLDNEMLNESTSDELFQTLRDAATAVSKDLSERAQDKGQLFDYDAGTVMPACVIATELYGDATRADEIVVRNGVAHPGYCPNVLKVLNE